MHLQKPYPQKLRRGRARVGVKSLAARGLRSPPIPTFPRVGGKEYDPLHENGVSMLCGLI